MLYKELSGPLKVLGKALLFSVRADSCSPKSLCLTCVYLEKAVAVITHLDWEAEVVGVSRREPDSEACLCCARFSNPLLSWSKHKALVQMQ